MFFLRKNRVISTAAVALLAVSFGSQAIGIANTAVISVTAKVINNTCEWKGASGDQTVSLGNANITDLLAGTEIAKDFTLELINCPDGTSVKARVTGAESGGLFENKSTSGPATNVGVSIWSNKSGTPTKVTNGKESEEYIVSSSTHAETLKFQARLEKTASGTPTAGDVLVPITMTIVYP